MIVVIQKKLFIRNYDNLQTPYKINNYNNPCINQYSDYKNIEPNSYRQISPYKSYNYQRLNYEQPNSNKNYIPTSSKNENNDLGNDNIIVIFQKEIIKLLN